MASLKLHTLSAISKLEFRGDFRNRRAISGTPDGKKVTANVVVVSVVRVVAWEVATYQGHGQFALRFEAQ